MNCKSYRDLSQQEQVEFIGRLVVAIQTKETAFIAGQMIVEAAEASGVYEKIKVGHEAVYQHEPAY